MPARDAKHPARRAWPPTAPKPPPPPPVHPIPGYWQLKMAPEMRRYMAVEWEGDTLVFEAYAFGFAPACADYTKLKREVYRLPRACGLKSLLYIDDANNSARGKPAAKFWARRLTRVLAALGFHLSLEKCVLLPATRVRVPGYGGGRPQPRLQSAGGQAGRLR